MLERMSAFGNPSRALPRNERCIDRQPFGEFIVKGTVLVKPFVQVVEQPFLANELALFLQAFFEPGLLEAFLCLLETRKRRKPFVKSPSSPGAHPRFGRASAPVPGALPISVQKGRGHCRRSAPARA